MATDKQLIEQIQKGKSEAYGQLFRRYYQNIYSVCFSILNNSHDAEEVTQETFVHAYLKLDQLKNPDKFFAWLKKIARNRSKNYSRRAGPEMIPLNLASVQDVSVLVKGYTPSQFAPDERLLRQELMDSIMDAVEALPPRDREVVRAHIDGLNHAEISERFGISVEASMSRLYRARKKLAANVKNLLNTIFGLPKMLPVKKIISGGILAMKIGTSAKITIGVIGVLVAGFIGFQVVTHQPDVKKDKTTNMPVQTTPIRTTKETGVKSTTNIQNENSITNPYETSKKSIPGANVSLGEFGETEVPVEDDYAKDTMENSQQINDEKKSAVPNVKSVFGLPPGWVRTKINGVWYEIPLGTTLEFTYYSEGTWNPREMTEEEKRRYGELSLEIREVEPGSEREKEIAAEINRINAETRKPNLVREVVSAGPLLLKNQENNSRSSNQVSNGE